MNDKAKNGEWGRDWGRGWGREWGIEWNFEWGGKWVSNTARATDEDDGEVTFRDRVRGDGAAYH